MDLSDQDLARFKKWLRGCLKTGVVTVIFTKKDGSERTMKCTTNPTYIMFKDPASLESKKDRKTNEDVMPVYDVEASSWKSFRWDSVKQIQITM